jgi:DNA-dependent protein kinase catalytic subunit
MEREKFEELVAFLFEVLRGMDESMFITCVHRVALNYPLISERFMAKLLHLLPGLHGEFKVMCAEAVLASIQTLEEPLLKTRSFMEMVAHRESSLQLVGLKVRSKGFGGWGF